MQYNFDQIIPRRGSGCVKHDGMVRDFGTNDLLPMWVADMDFASPDFVLDAIRQRCDHPVLGYAVPQESYFQTMTSWLERHYAIAAQRSQLHFIPGIVAGIAFAIQALTQPGDKILVTTPVYPPFLNLPQGSVRQLCASPLQYREGRFYIDFDDFEQRASECRLFILSNPHNPGGVIWTREELERMAEICHRHGVIIIDDEIHADLTLPGYRHTSLPSLGGVAAQNCLTFIAPSKTFNIAGLGSSICYCADPDLRSRYFGYLDTYEVANGNIFAFAGAEAAFRYGEDWLQQLKQYLAGNVALLHTYLRHYLPKVQSVLPQASFLAWLDFSAYGYSHEELRRRFIEVGKLAMNDGTTFGGPAYQCCFRINLGCPRQTLEQALDGILRSVE